MLKLFDNTAALTFDRTASKVIGMVSSEKETFEFRTPQPTEGAVELWLGLVEAEMITTLRREQKESTFHYPKSNRVEWVKDNLGLMVNTGAQVWWTYEVGDVFVNVRKGDRIPMGPNHTPYALYPMPYTLLPLTLSLTLSPTLTPTPNLTPAPTLTRCARATRWA